MRDPSPDGGGALAYNGEVYNWLALRAELEREGVRFRSRCDSEVVLHAMDLSAELAVPRLAPRQHLFDTHPSTCVLQPLEHEARRGAFGKRVGDLPAQRRAGISVDRHMPDTGEVDARLTQAVASRFSRHSGPVLQTPEAFLFGGCNELAVGYQVKGPTRMQWFPMVP